MADPIYIDASGNQIPAQSTPEPSYIDASGKTIDPKIFQQPKGSPSLEDISPSDSTIQGITRAGVKTLPALGAAGFTALAPEAPGVSGMAGAAAGSALQNFLRSYSPKYFSENGQPPNATDQMTNIATNVGLEGTGQLLTQAAPNAVKAGLNLVGKIPPFSSGVAQEQNAQALLKLRGIANQGNKEGVALKNVLDEGSKNGKINDTDAIREALQDKNLTHAWNTSNVADPNTGTRVTKSYDDMIPQETRDNLKKILDTTDKFKETPNTDGLMMKAGKYALKLGGASISGAAIGGFAGMPETGAALGGTIYFTNSMLQKAAQNPAITKAMVTAMNPSSSPALTSLARQGILNAMRGEETYFEHPDGTKEKVKISDQGVPQTIR